MRGRRWAHQEGNAPDPSARRVARGSTRLLAPGPHARLDRLAGFGGRPAKDNQYDGRHWQNITQQESERIQMVDDSRGYGTAANRFFRTNDGGLRLRDLAYDCQVFEGDLLCSAGLPFGVLTPHPILDHDVHLRRQRQFVPADGCELEYGHVDLRRAEPGKGDRVFGDRDIRNAIGDVLLRFGCGYGCLRERAEREREVPERADDDGGECEFDHDVRSVR